jgi:hypothetical protein
VPSFQTFPDHALEDALVRETARLMRMFAAIFAAIFAVLR